MAHETRGIYRLLESAVVYGLLQRVLGAHRARVRFVHEFVQPPPNSRILDIGCGRGDLLAYLPEDVDYLGLDLNPQYIAQARRRFGARGQFLCADARELDEQGLNGAFDLVLLVALLHHLDDDEATNLLARAHLALKPGGRLVTFDGVLHDGQSAAARWLLLRDRGTSVRTPEQYRELVARSFEKASGHLLTDWIRVPYSHYVICAQRERVTQ